MNKNQFFKIAGVKSEAEFYRKYPTEEAFQKAHGKEFKKAKLGAAMTPKAQIGGIMGLDKGVEKACTSKTDCHGELKTAVDAGPSKSERKADAAFDKETARLSAQEAKETAAQKAQEWAEYTNTGLDAYGEKYGRKDKTFSDSYNKFIAANPKFAEEQSTLGLSPEQRYAMINKMAGRSGSADFAAPQRLRSYMKLPEGSRFTDQQLYDATQKMGGIDKYAEWWKGGYPEIQKYGGETKKLNQLTNFTNDVDGIMPIAQDGSMIGSYMGGETTPMAKPLSLTDYYASNVSQLTGKPLSETMKLSANGEYKAPRDWGSMIKQVGKQVEDMVSLPQKGSAKNGKHVPKYQFSGPGLGLNDPMGGSMGAIPNTLNQYGWNTNSGGIGGAPNVVPPNPNVAPPMLDTQQTGSLATQIGKSAGAVNPSASGLMGRAGGISGIANIAGDIVGGIQGLKEEKRVMKNAMATRDISRLTRKAASTRPEQIERQYLRPEDQTVQPDQLFPTYGVGTNYLSRNGSVVRAEGGMQVGGNPTEIQNTYAPNNLYDDLGYEPLSDSEIVKQYRAGGFMPIAQGGGNFLTQNAGAIQGVGNLTTQVIGRQNAGSQLGKGIGTAVGTAIPIPGLGAALGAVGGVVGGILDKKGKKTEKAQKETQGNVQAMAMQQGLQGALGQYSANVRNGGNIYEMEEGGWVSHDWQPQVITQFGEHKMSDLLRHDDSMDTLRSGGHLKQNYVEPSQRALDTMALGGELKTTWGGYAEPISHNPYMPGTGETVMFRGKSHDESDGKGHTGIGVKYGDGGMTDYAEFGSQDADADVEVERGEPAQEMLDGETGEKNMVVFGNLKISGPSANHIGDYSAKGKKFKNYVNDLSKIEAKQNKIVEKSSNQIDDLKVYTPFDKLRMNALEANVNGANMKLKDIAVKKTNASAVQNAINDTAAEHGLSADDLAVGKIKIDKEAMKQQAKYGREIAKAQVGTELNLSNYPFPIKLNQPQPWQGVAPRYLGDLSEAWDPEGKTNKKFYTDAFKKFTDQMKEGKTPFIPYSLNSNVAKVYEKALKDFNDQLKPITSDGTAQAPFTKTGGKPTTTTVPTATTTVGGGNKKGRKVVTTKGKTAMKVTPASKAVNQEEIPMVDINLPGSGIEDDSSTMATTTGQTTNPVQSIKRNKWMDAANALLPYVRPTDQEPLDMAQLYPEMYAMATNQVEPVQAQLYHPDLGTPMDISLQDQMNANQADFNALQRQTGYNPAAESALASQKYKANSSVLGEQFRLNQAEKQRVNEGNRATLNDAQLKNLNILDNQMVRQETAKSKTKEVAQAALNSMASKIAQNKLENRQLGIYENLYNYRYDKSGRAINMNPLNQFDYTVGSEKGNRGGGLASGLEFTYDASGNIVGTRKSKDEAKNGAKLKKDQRNGNIVKSIKNL